MHIKYVYPFLNVELNLVKHLENNKKENMLKIVPHTHIEPFIDHSHPPTHQHM